MATCSNIGKQTRTLLDFNFVKKRKFNEEQDESSFTTFGKIFSTHFCFNIILCFH